MYPTEIVNDKPRTSAKRYTALYPNKPKTKTEIALYVTPLLNKSYYCTGLHPPHQRPRSVSYWSLENLTRCPIEVARLSNRHAEARGKLLRVIAGGAWTKLFHVIVGDVYAVIFSTKG